MEYQQGPVVALSALPNGTPFIRVGDNPPVGRLKTNGTGGAGVEWVDLGTGNMGSDGPTTQVVAQGWKINTF